MRRPIWLGAGIALGVGGTLWAEQRVRRHVRRAVDLLSPVVAGNEAMQSVREMGVRVRDAVDVARAERRRHESELWRRMGEVPTVRAPGVRHSPSSSERQRPKGARRQHR
jgi:hypothetical protein